MGIAQAFDTLTETRFECQRLTEEYHSIESAGGAVADWLQHMQGRLGKLHEDGSTLQVEIAEAEEQRAKLREEEIQAVPVRQAVTNEKQVRWLKKYTQEAAEKRAFLLEEISFEQARESRFQLEASVRREEAVLEESHL